MSRVKRSYDVFSSSSTSAPSAHFSRDPHSDLSLAHKRSRPIETSLSRQMSTDDDMSKSPVATAHDNITSAALQLTAPSAAASSSSSPFQSASASVLSPSSGASVHSHSRSTSPSTEEQSRFPSRHRQFDVSAFVESQPHKRKRNHSNMDLSSAATHTPFSPNKEQRVMPMSSSSTSLSSLPSSSPSFSSPTSSSSQPVYSLEQVKRIVKSALQLQEDRLREEYNAVLNELLREQFENFDRFNKDYISRQLRHTDLSYLS